MNNMSFTRDGSLISPTSLAAKEGVQRDIPLISRYLAILRRRKWIIVGAVLVTVLLGLAVTLLMTRQYTASATVEIQRESYNIVQVDGVEPESSSVDLEFYQTQYGLLRAKSLAERVIVDLKLQDDQSFFELFDSSEAKDWWADGRLVPAASTREQRVSEGADLLLKNIEILPERLSRLVQIRFTSPDPALSKKVVDSWAENFISSTLERRFDATSYARNFLETRLVQLRKRLDESERQLVAYAARQGIVNVPTTDDQDGGERPIAAEDLASLNRSLSEATADRVRAESRLQSTSAATSEALDNQAISTMRQRRAELASEYAKLLVQFDPEYPAARGLASQIARLDRELSREEGRVRSSLVETYEAAANRESQLKGLVGNSKSELLDLRRRSIQYNIYKRDVDTNRQLYDGLLQRYKEIGVAGGVGVNNIAIVDKAEIPTRPSSPNLILNLLIACLAGVLVGAAAAFALEQMDEAISDPSSVEGMLGMPLLGTIPKVKGEEPVEALTDRKSPVAEAYISVQTNLAFSTDHGVPRTLAITSTRPAEGKSTTSYAIAHTLARSNRKVVLIDADMRSPSVHHLLDLNNHQGLSNYLAGDDDLQRMIQATEVPSLSAMAAGPQPPSAPELLASGRFEKMIAELLMTYDNVIFDAPPVMGLADAPLVSSRVEGTIFVIESHGTKRSMAQVAVGRLRSANAQLLGTVLTKFEAKRSHYGYGYEYGYGYGEDSPSA